jgi:hypothetical protein
LEILKLGGDQTRLDEAGLDDGLILGDFSLFPKKRKIDKGKGREV